MNTFSCDVTLTVAQSEQFNKTMQGRRIGHVKLDEMLSIALSKKYNPDQLVLLNMAKPPAPLSVFFEVQQVRDLANGSSITTYFFDAPLRTRLVAKMFDPEHDMVNSANGDLISDARTFSPIDSRAGPLIRAMRRKRGTPKTMAVDPIGASSLDRIRMVIRSVPDDGQREFDAAKG